MSSVSGLIRPAPHLQTERQRRRRQRCQPDNPFRSRGPGPTGGRPHPRDRAGHDEGPRRALILRHLALRRDGQLCVRAGPDDERQPVPPALPQLAAVVLRSLSWSGSSNNCQVSASFVTSCSSLSRTVSPSRRHLTGSQYLRDPVVHQLFQHVAHVFSLLGG
jgi:hypothetical protein